MKKILMFIAALSFLFILAGCSSTPESIYGRKDENKTEQPKDSVYVFDEVVQDTTHKEDIIPVPTKKDSEIDIKTQKSTKYAVQIGAYTSLEKADEFAEIARKQFKKEFAVTYSDEVKLFVIQTKSFIAKEDAENLRNEFWKIKEYKDAFVVTVLE